MTTIEPKTTHFFGEMLYHQTIRTLIYTHFSSFVFLVIKGIRYIFSPIFLKQEHQNYVEYHLKNSKLFKKYIIWQIKILKNLKKYRCKSKIRVSLFVHGVLWLKNNQILRQCFFFFFSHVLCFKNDGTKRKIKINRQQYLFYLYLYNKGKINIMYSPCLILLSWSPPLLFRLSRPLVVTFQAHHSNTKVHKVVSEKCYHNEIAKKI